MMSRKNKASIILLIPCELFPMNAFEDKTNLQMEVMIRFTNTTAFVGPFSDSDDAKEYLLRNKLLGCSGVTEVELTDPREKIPKAHLKHARMIAKITENRIRIPA